jgi:hypothetical protein
MATDANFVPITDLDIWDFLFKDERTFGYDQGKSYNLNYDINSRSRQFSLSMSRLLINTIFEKSKAWLHPLVMHFEVNGPDTKEMSLRPIVLTRLTHPQRSSVISGQEPSSRLQIQHTPQPNWCFNQRTLVKGRC